MEPVKIEIAVVGAGPGGYTAAFYAASQGKKVVLIDQNKRLGGTCLNHGCIPSKALLHIAKLITEAREADACGITFSGPKVQLEKLRNWKESILEKLGQGIAGLAGRHGVQVVQGKAQFENSRTLRVGSQIIEFEKAVIASGSRTVLPRTFDIKDKRVMTSAEALALEEIPKKLLVVGGGYIGMELGTVYAALGSEVTVAEALDGILLGADPDLVRLVQEYATHLFKEIRLNAKVLEMKPQPKGIEVKMVLGGEEKREVYDRVLVSVGREPNSQGLGLERTKVGIDKKGFIQVDKKQQTEDPDIYAIGDVVGGALLAHKASREAKTAIDAICGETNTAKDYLIPAVVFTNPELAWCGLTETEAKTSNIPVQIVKFPWAASGRAMTIGRTDGVTKLLIDPKTEKILGAGICGAGAGELISEVLVAIERGATAKDLEHIVHPHPTLSETLMECAAMFYGRAIHAYSRKRN